MSRINRIIVIVSLCISVVMIISFAVVSGIQKHVWRNKSVLRLLQDVCIATGNLNEELLEFEYWKDPISYISGYEIALFEVDADSWTTPEGWRREKIAITELGDVTGFSVPEHRFTGLETALPAHSIFLKQAGRGPLMNGSIILDCAAMRGFYLYTGVMICTQIL